MPSTVAAEAVSIYIPLKNTAYRRLFIAHVGTSLSTVALTLVAHDLLYRIKFAGDGPVAKVMHISWSYGHGLAQILKSFDLLQRFAVFSVNLFRENLSN